MEALVWVDAYQVQSFGGEPFAVGQHVTWPISGQLNRTALTEHVGADTAAEVSMGVDWHARRAEDTVDHTGIVTRIEVYRCRLAQGHVVPGTVETYPVVEASGWEPEEDGVHFVGYLVTLTNIRQAVESWTDASLGLGTRTDLPRSARSSDERARPTNRLRSIHVG